MSPKGPLMGNRAIKTTSRPYVSHAVAVNENRADFHGVSIHRSPTTSATEVESRQERGFIGAHSDIGGGYAEGDLSDVAFMWMVRRAESSGVRMDRDYISNNQRRWNIVTEPVIHDSVGVAPFFLSGRRFKYLDFFSEERQHDWTGNQSMNHALSQDFFDTRYQSPCGFANISQCNALDNEENETLVGLVDGDKYSQWLRRNYGLEIVINEDDLDENGLPRPVAR